MGRIAAEYNGSSTVYKLTVNQKPGKIFLAEATLSDQLAITQAGDTIKLAFIEGDGQSIHCLLFENQTIR